MRMPGGLSVVAALNSGLNPSSLQSAAAVTSGPAGLTTSLPVNSTAAMSSAAQQLFIMQQQQPNNGQQQPAANHPLAPASLAGSSMSPSAISNASSCSPTTNLLNSTASSLVGSNLSQAGQANSTASGGSSTSAFTNNSALAALAYYYPAYHHLANSSQLATSSVPL